MSSEKTYWIEDPAQLSLLTSAVRQDIFDSVHALGACSIADLAHELGVPADTLYYHVHKMVEAGLLVVQGARTTRRREEAVYDLPSRDMRVRYVPSDPENVRLLCRAVGGMLRVAERDFQNGFTPEQAVVEGKGRNLSAVRFKAWLNGEELREVNHLLDRLAMLFQHSRQPGDRKLHTLAWVLTPVEDQPPRR